MLGHGRQDRTDRDRTGGTPSPSHLVLYAVPSTTHLLHENTFHAHLCTHTCFVPRPTCLPSPSQPRLPPLPTCKTDRRTGGWTGQGQAVRRTLFSFPLLPPMPLPACPTCIYIEESASQPKQPSPMKRFWLDRCLLGCIGALLHTAPSLPHPSTAFCPSLLPGLCCAPPFLLFFPTLVWGTGTGENRFWLAFSSPPYAYLPTTTPTHHCLPFPPCLPRDSCLSAHLLMNNIPALPGGVGWWWWVGRTGRRDRQWAWGVGQKLRQFVPGRQAGRQALYPQRSYTSYHWVLSSAMCPTFLSGTSLLHAGMGMAAPACL